MIRNKFAICPALVVGSYGVDRWQRPVPSTCARCDAMDEEFISWGYAVLRCHTVMCRHCVVGGPIQPAAHLIITHLAISAQWPIQKSLGLHFSDSWVLNSTSSLSRFTSKQVWATLSSSLSKFRSIMYKPRKLKQAYRRRYEMRRSPKPELL